MLAAVEGVRVLTSSWPVAFRLAAAIGVGAPLYAGVVYLLARNQLYRIAGIVLKRRPA